MNILIVGLIIYIVCGVINYLIITQAHKHTNYKITPMHMVAVLCPVLNVLYMVICLTVAFKAKIKAIRQNGFIENLTNKFFRVSDEQKRV